MNNHDIQTKIDDFLLNRLTKAEQQAFEIELEVNPELKETVELQRLLVTEIQQRAFISEIISETEERIQKPKGLTITFRKVMVTSWSAAAIFIGVFFVNSAIQNSRMDRLYAEMYSAPHSDVMRGDNGVRGNSDKKEFLAATKLLADNHPEQALDALEKLYSYPISYGYYEEVRWYLALTELKLHHKSEAKKYLNELAGSEAYDEKVKKVLSEL